MGGLADTAANSDDKCTELSNSCLNLKISRSRYCAAAPLVCPLVIRGRRNATTTAIHLPVTVPVHHPPRDGSSRVPHWLSIVSRLLCLRHEPLQHRVEGICGVRRRPDRTQLVFLPRQQVLGDTEPEELSRVHAQIPGAGPREASQGGGRRKGCNLHDLLQG